MSSTAEIIAVVGFVSAITTDIIRRRIGDGRKRAAIRKALYDELEVIYSIFDSTRQALIQRPELNDLTVKVLTSVGMDAYKSAKSQPEVFYGLKEAGMIDALYIPVTALKKHYVLPGMGRPAMEVRDQFIELFERALKANTLDVQFFSPSFVRYVHVSTNAIGQPAGAKELR